MGKPCVSHPSCGEGASPAGLSTSPKPSKYGDLDTTNGLLSACYADEREQARSPQVSISQSFCSASRVNRCW